MPHHASLKLSAAALGAAACLLAGAVPAGAAVIVLGNSKAHLCYLAAKSGVDVRGGLKLCNEALVEGEMPARDIAATHVNRGVLLDAVGRYDEATEDYNRSITLEPSLGDAYLNRGVAMIRLKRFDDGLADIQKGMGLGIAEQAIGYYDLAVAEEDMGCFKEAYYDYKHALTLEPGYTPASEALKHFVVTKSPAPPPAPSGGT